MILQFIYGLFFIYFCIEFQLLYIKNDWLEFFFIIATILGATAIMIDPIVLFISK